MNQNRYRVIFFKNNIKTVTMEKFADNEEEAIKLCIEKLSHLNMSDIFDRHEIEQLPKRQLWE